MQGNLSHSVHTYSNLVSLGGNHGYRFEGDTAILNAELAIASHAQADQHGSQHWALQLWACETPYQGGPLRGLKVAEAELALPTLPTLTFDGEHEHTHLETAAFAHLPLAQGEYSMVLVLASGDHGRYDQVHDFSNYRERQQFAGLRLEGNVGYRFEDDSVVLSAGGVRNTRGEDNLSGSLSLQLWALSQPYDGGLLRGTLLAQSALGRLEGQGEQLYLEQRVPLTEAPVGDWQLALVLTEWTDAAGWLTRDFCNFAEQHHVAERSWASSWQQPSYDDASSYQEPQYVEPQQTSAWNEPVAAATEAHQPEVVAAAPAIEPVPTPAVIKQEVAPAKQEVAPALAAKPVVAAPAVAAKQEVAAPVATAPKAEAVAPKVVAIAPEKPVLAAATQAEPAKPALASPVSSAKPLETQAPTPPKLVAVAAPAPLQAKAEPAPAASASPAGRISVHTASVDELANIEGLNKKLAQAIVKARPFKSLEEVVKVRGIGEKMLHRLREQLTL